MWVGRNDLGDQEPLAWDVPTNLDQANPDDYKTCLEDSGYRNILVEDATEQTWRSWIRQLVDTTEVTGVPAPHRHLHDAKRSNVVTYYVLASAQK